MKKDVKKTGKNITSKSSAKQFYVYSSSIPYEWNKDLFSRKFNLMSTFNVFSYYGFCRDVFPTTSVSRKCIF